MRHRSLIIASAALAGIGVVIAELWRPDDRGAVAPAALTREAIITTPLESAPAAVDAVATPWREHLAAVHVAVSSNDATAAARAWRTAYAEAHRARSWEALAEVADAALVRRGLVSGRPAAERDARQAYRASLMWARRTESADGVLRVAEALTSLADRGVVRYCLRTAERIAAAQGPAEWERVRQRIVRIEHRLVTRDASL